jgi:hypothetical protein
LLVNLLDNQMRLVLHTAAYWPLLTVRDATDTADALANPWERRRQAIIASDRRVPSAAEFQRLLRRALKDFSLEF